MRSIQKTIAAICVFLLVLTITWQQGYLDLTIVEYAHAAACMDGVVDEGEECDDGNDNDLDACSNSCVINFCGDAVENNGEQCDDGNLDDTDDCLSSCLDATCM